MFLTVAIATWFTLNAGLAVVSAVLADRARSEAGGREETSVTIAASGR